MFHFCTSDYIIKKVLIFYIAYGEKESIKNNLLLWPSENKSNVFIRNVYF